MPRLWNPAVFQGGLRKTGYFEGWYFKQVSPDGRAAYAVIPGVSLPGGEGRPHAFIQFLDAGISRSCFVKYDLCDFRAEKKAFEIRIRGNYFSLNRMLLDIDAQGASVRADLRSGNIHPWPVSWLSPGAMGWYAFVPRMECCHGVLSFNSSLDGYFEVDGRKESFTGGKGYVEKDWGRSMPRSWIWMQTNHFYEPEASFTGSIAKIPWLGGFFTGFLFGLYLKGRVYRFTTYTGARLRGLALDDNRISFSVEDSRCGLEVTGHRAHGAPLVAPKMGGMTVRIDETLDSEISLVFYRRQGHEVMLSGTGRHAGLEYVGDVGELVEGLR